MDLSKVIPIGASLFESRAERGLIAKFGDCLAELLHRVRRAAGSLACRPSAAGSAACEGCTSDPKSTTTRSQDERAHGSSLFRVLFVGCPMVQRRT